MPRTRKRNYPPLDSILGDRFPLIGSVEPVYVRPVGFRSSDAEPAPETTIPQDFGGSLVPGRVTQPVSRFSPLTLEADRILKEAEEYSPSHPSRWKDPKNRNLLSYSRMVDQGTELMVRSDYERHRGAVSSDSGTDHVDRGEVSADSSPEHKDRSAGAAEPWAPWAERYPDLDRPEESATDMAELLDRYPLTPAERAVALLVLDGRATTQVNGHVVEFMPQVAEALGISHVAARQRWTRAKTKLRGSYARGLDPGQEAMSQPQARTGEETAA